MRKNFACIVAYDSAYPAGPYHYHLPLSDGKKGKFTLHDTEWVSTDNCQKPKENGQYRRLEFRVP